MGIGFVKKGYPLGIFGWVHPTHDEGVVETAVSEEPHRVNPCFPRGIHERPVYPTRNGVQLRIKHDVIMYLKK